MRQQAQQLWKNKQRSMPASTSTLLLLAVAFAVGFCVGRTSAPSPIFVPLMDVIPATATGTRRSHSAKGEAEAVQMGIWPLMRDFRCGADNLETPRAIAAGSVGRGRFVVDVGLGVDGQETLDAVTNGFTVFSFEMMTGSMEGIKQAAKDRGILHKLHFVEFENGPDGNAKPKSLPMPPTDGSGFAYIFNAGLSDEVGAMNINQGIDMIAKISQQKTTTAWKPGMVPFMTLDQALPNWVDSIFFVKIDTQGWEAKVLRGMEKILDLGIIKYLQYELSPMLMKEQNTGDSLELLKLLPSKGAICFDMMGVHNKITRPSKDMEAYHKSISTGEHPALYAVDNVGPWDDILCWFPDATK